jgi:hypothetical protein
MDTLLEKLPEKNSFQVYYGNDCYGRGTYAGGLYNVCEALKVIHNYPFSVAIFGQAFTWEKDDSFLNYETFFANENKFWYGVVASNCQ